MIDQIQSQFSYNTWANTRLLDTAAKLTPEQFTGVHHATFGSLRNVIVHMVYAEQLWILRAQGLPAPTRLQPQDYETVDAIRAEWRPISEVTQRFVASLTEADLERTVRYVNNAGEPQAYPLWQTLFHLVNHSMQHRSEAALVMTTFGYSTGWLDYLIYVDETRDVDNGPTLPSHRA